jgi:gentisate 1,2-dioxygenase
MLTCTRICPKSAGVGDGEGVWTVVNGDPVRMSRERISPAETTTPERSRAERLWSYPGLRPVSQPDPQPAAPLLLTGGSTPTGRWQDS